MSCNNGDDGSIDLIVSGGSGSYTYLWNNGSTSEDLFDLISGSYSVEVFDDFGCSVNLDFEITQSEELIISSELSNISCYGGSDGSIDLTVSGGTAPYLYIWSNGDETQDISNLVAGNYLVDVIDSNGCSSSTEIQINEPSEILAEVSVINISCSGSNDGSIDISVSGGTAPYTYLWSNGENTEDLSNLSGNQFLSVEITDSNNCVLFISDIYISEPEPMTISENHTMVSCYGESDAAIDISVSGGSGEYTYNWSNGSVTQDINNLSTGVYFVIATDENDCTVSIEVEITEPEELIISSELSNISCYGVSDGSIDLTVSGGVTPYNYFWSNGETTEDLSNIGPGLYSVLVTDTNNCTETLEFEITEPEELTIIADVSNISCFGGNDGSIDITVSGGTGNYSYAWNGGASNSEDIINGWAGSYYVYIEDDNGCSISAEFEISEPESFSVSFTSNAGEYVDCNSGQLSVIVEGGTAPYSYEWDNGSTDSNLFDLCAGDYSVTVTDANGCSISEIGSVDLLIPEGWEVNESSVYHEIIIPSDASLLLDGVDLNTGDFIGVFFINNEGVLSCGGYTIWQGVSTSILAYGNDGEIDGFDEGEQFQWKVFNGETYSGFAIYDDFMIKIDFGYLLILNLSFEQIIGQSGISPTWANDSLSSQNNTT